MRTASRSRASSIRGCCSLPISRTWRRGSSRSRSGSLASRSRNTSSQSAADSSSPCPASPMRGISWAGLCSRLPEPLSPATDNTHQKTGAFDMTLRLPLMAAALAVALGSMAGSVRAAVAPMDLVGPVSEYKIYVSEKLQKLVADTKAFTDAVKAGDIEKAKALFGPTRMSYEQIEPVAELFSDLDVSIDSRADD